VKELGQTPTTTPSELCLKPVPGRRADTPHPRAPLKPSDRAPSCVDCVLQVQQHVLYCYRSTTQLEKDLLSEGGYPWFAFPRHPLRSKRFNRTLQPTRPTTSDEAGEDYEIIIVEAVLNTTGLGYMSSRNFHYKTKKPELYYIHPRRRPLSALSTAKRG
jgi:hypothetical protein